jgi:hypothetical protein
MPCGYWGYVISAKKNDFRLNSPHPEVLIENTNEWILAAFQAAPQINARLSKEYFQQLMKNAQLN